MTKLINYLDDGANWQAQAVLAYLRSMYESILDETYNKEIRNYEASFNVGRYENCREQGYIFSLRYKNVQRNYAVYEHRNTDDLCVVVFDGNTINTPEAKMVWDAMGIDNYNETEYFPYGEIITCGEYIFEDATIFIERLKEATDRKS